MTKIEEARKGIVGESIKVVAERENVSPEFLLEGLCEGRIVIPWNRLREIKKPCGIGEGLRTKVNANIGTSPDVCDVELEVKKLKAALDAGADTVMDLSTGGDIGEIRRRLISICDVPFGTVPIYQAGIEAIERYGAIVKMREEDIFEAIREHARDGVDFMTIHAGLTMKGVERLKKQGRLTDVVSRGGTFLIGWMLHNERENPLYEKFDLVLEIAREYDITLSLGDGLRPGSIMDSSDRAQIEELLTIGELVDRAREACVQVIVEGPGHVPLDEIQASVLLEKKVCKGAPFYVLGPLVTDIASGYDHIAGAIGGAIASASGADFLCYVTPSEHLSIPSPEDVEEGVIGAKIAAHAGDMVKGVKGAMEWDEEMSKARKNLDWERQIKLSINPDKARRIHDRYPSRGVGCSMCGKYCAVELINQFLRGEG